MFLQDSDIQFINKTSSHKPNQPQMIECFATWCGPCRMMVPHLGQLTQKYPNVHIVSVSQEDFGTVSQFSQSNPQTKAYNLAVDTNGKVGAIMNQFGVNGIPHAFLVNSDGKVVWHGHPGQCEQEIAKLNNSYTPQQPKSDNNQRTTISFASLMKK
ncbi:FixW_protein [Hexamita inflata]|uniref:Putative n=1 Tax=Hexamita inflata TaxID=28002 RepID=A0AA86QBG6_9EUKA|nr:FixW protein [Hexamita inflata]CAI9960441.1 FixW protein [Hexamita inflata]CAI9960445.1 FixW protein [Hexamita inflata]